MKKVINTYHILVVSIIISMCSCAKFDAKTPDTKANKVFFKNLLKLEPTDDVSDIYCYADQMGIDAAYQIAFKCDSITILKIAEKLDLTKADTVDNYSEGIWRTQPWWDEEKIIHLYPYYKKDDLHRVYWFLWYENQTKKAYFITYDM